jgi:hypothetical protein
LYDLKDVPGLDQILQTNTLQKISIYNVNDGFWIAFQNFLFNQERLHSLKIDYCTINNFGNPSENLTLNMQKLKIKHLRFPEKESFKNLVIT